MAIGVLHVPLGSLLLLLIIFARTLPMVSTAQQTYQRILHQLPAYLGIQTLKQACQEEYVPATKNKLSYASEIQLQSICFSYPTKPETYIIDTLSLTLKKNSITALIGPSGAGKSTLADLIVGLLKPTSGDIFIDGQRLDNSNYAAWQRNIAYVTQDVFLFHASVRDNLTWFSSNYTDTELWDALNISAADFVHHLDEGLDTMLGDRGVRLSGGERQRIALARALLMKPKLLVLDESTHALDFKNIQKIQTTLAVLRVKMTILLISHQHEMSMFADQKVILKPRGKDAADVIKQHTILDTDPTAVM